MSLMLRKFIRQSYNEPQVLAAVRNPQTLVMMSQGLGFGPKAQQIT